MPYLVELPDGRRVEFPDSVSKEEAARVIREQLLAPAREEPERTIGGYAKEAVKGIIPGAVSGIESAITGAASILPEEAEQAIRRPVSGFAERVREAFAPEAGYEDTAVRKLSEAIGSTAPFLGAGLLGAAGRAAAVGLGVATGAGEARQRAEAEEATEGERGVATALGIAPGALESLPPIRILRRLGFGDEALAEIAKDVPALRRIAAAGGEEALQEASSQVLQNAIAKGVYKPEEELLGGVGEAAALGGGAGAIISAIAELAIGRRGARAEPTEEPPPEEELKALPPPRVAGYEIDSQGNVVREITEAEAETRGAELARLQQEGRYMGLGESEAIQERMQEQREKDFLGQMDARLRAATEAEDAAVAAKDDLRYLRSLPMAQIGLGLEGGEARPDTLLEPPVEPRPQMFISGEEALTKAIEQRQLETGEQIRPRSRAYREEAKDLGVRLDRKGEVKPNQAVFEQPKTEVAPEQMGFNLPGVPMERLAPRDRVLRAMAISEDKKNIPNLRFATGLRQMELQRAIGDLRKEGAISFNKQANEWELTPAGAENVRTGRKPKPRRRRAGVGVPVQQRGAATTPAEGVESLRVAGTGADITRVDEREEPSQPALTKPDRISERIISSNAGSDFVKDLYSPDPVDAVLTSFEDLDTVTPKEINQSKEYIKSISQNLLRNEFGDEVTLYRGLKGTEERSPVLSYTLNEDVAKFQATQQGIRTGKIEKIRIPVSEVLSYSQAIGRGTFAEDEVIIPASARRVSASPAAPPAPPVDRIELIRRAQEKIIARRAIDEVQARKSALSTQAIDAFERGVINDVTYSKIVEELKKPAPNFAFVTNKLTARIKAPVQDKPTSVQGKEAPKIGLSENATDAEIAAYYKKTGGSKTPPVVKKERGVPLIKLQQEEDAADAFLRAAEEKAAPTVPVPKVHPEWATKFEPDVGGEVVYSDEDTALVRGSSVLSGQNVYMAVDRKSGGRTRVDIESFTGSTFSPEQKQRLIQAKKQIAAEDKAKFDANPDGPFTGATSNVVASDGVNPNYANFLRSLMKSMGLGDIRVFLFHPEDVRNNKDKYKLYGTYSSALSAGLDFREDGSLRPYGFDLKDFYISVKPGMSDGRTVEVIAHELGHLIEKVAFNNAPKNVKAAIMAEYNEWLGNAKKKSGSDLIYALRNRETAEAQAAGKTPETKLAMENSYWRSFTEWFADNTSKWATTSEKPVGIVEKFFADLAKKLRELVAKLTGNRFVPAKTVKDFLDAMGPGSAAAWKDAEGPLDGSPFDDAARYSMSPTEQRANDRNFINKVAKIPESGAKATEELLESARNATSNMPPKLRRAWFSMLTPHNFDQMYGKYTKSFGNLWNALNEEGVALRKREDAISENAKKWNELMSKYSPAERDRIYKLMLDTTVEQIEVLDLTDKTRGIEWQAKKDHPLYKSFMKLDAPVRKMYEDLRLAYLDYALGVENSLKQYLTPTEWQKIKSELNARRLPVYLPLFRSGDYKLTYKDKDDQYVSRLFNSRNERNKAAEEVRRQGAKDIQISMREDFDSKAVPPSGFVGEIVGLLRKKDVDEGIVQQVFETYMDYLPVNSVLQLSRKREATPGFELDILQAYANVAGSYARKLSNMELEPKLREFNEQFKTDMAIAVDKGKIDPDLVSDLKTTANKQLNYIRNPNLNNWSAKLGYFSYTMYLGANISTAIVNILDIPTITLSRLGRKHGFAKSTAALTQAGKLFFSKNKPKEIQELLQRGLDSGVVREQKLRDLAEFKNLDSSFERIKAGTDRVINWAFAKSDLFNREVALIAAYQLAKNKALPDGQFDEAAFKEAQRTVYDVYGSSFPKAGPPIMGNGLARTALTFKRFAITRMWLLGTAFKEAAKGESKEVRDAARKELIGYFGTAYVFAGMQGMPVVGAGMTIVSMLNAIFGDDDEPYNPEFAMREAVGLFNYKGPVNYAFGVDIASRTGWTGMFWREDPKRLAEVGPVTYVVEQALGPAYSYAVGVPRAIELFSEGQGQRAFEQLAPRVFSNISKGIRYAQDGAVTADGTPLVENVDAYNVFMQLFGFRPSDVAESGEEAGAAKRMESKILERRNALIARAALAQMAGDGDGFAEAIQEAAEFSRKNPNAAISPKVIRRAIERRYKKMAESVNGVRVNPKLATDIYEELGIDPFN